MAKIFKLFPCASITHLDCRTAMHLTLTSWREALVRLPALETVYIGVNIGATRLLLALLESVEKANGRYPPLRCIYFSTPISTRGGSAGTEPVAPVFAALEDLLGVLFSRGIPLERLEINEQGGPLDIEEENWDALSQLVGTLIRNNDRHAPTGDSSALFSRGANP
jgi:hypothetical protein